MTKIKTDYPCDIRFCFSIFSSLSFHLCKKMQKRLNIIFNIQLLNIVYT